MRLPAAACKLTPRRTVEHGLFVGVRDEFTVDYLHPVGGWASRVAAVLDFETPTASKPRRNHAAFQLREHSDHLT